MSLENFRKNIAGLYYGWRMIGIVSALRVLGGGLHQYGFTVFFLPVTQDLGLTRASTALAFSLARAEGSLTAPIVGYLLDRHGPKPLLAGVLFLVAGLPLCLGIHRSPESIGMQPDGAPLTPKSQDGKPTETAAGHKAEADITAREAFRSPIFWNLICSMTCRSVAFTTVTTHFIPMMVWKGLSQTEASVLLAGFALINLPIHFLLGWIADFVNKPKLVTICLFLGVVAVLPMLWSNSLWALWFFTGLYSVLDASIPVFWASVGDFFGRKSFGTIRGNMNLFYTWGAILGPFVAGAIYDQTQSYALVFSGITISLLISTAMTALLIKPWAKLGTRIA